MRIRNQERAEEMYRRRCAGDTLQKIADDYGLTRERIRQITERYAFETGIEAPRRPSTPSKKRTAREQREVIRQGLEERILALDNSGCTQVEITELLGISRGTIASTLLRLRGRIRHRSPNVLPPLAHLWKEQADAGMKQSRIAQLAGYTQKTVSCQLQKIN